MKITPNLWFDGQAEAAAKFYTSIFKKSSIKRTSYFLKEGQEIHGQPEGSVMTVEFELNGQPFIALNGGPQFKFNEAISLFIPCSDQAEIDYYWDKLSEGGDPRAQQCGWLKDKFGVSWQVAPTILDDMMMDADKKKAGRAMQAMLKMKKMDIATLEKAFNG